MVVDLPAPFGPREPEGLAGMDQKVDAFDRLHRLEGFDEAFDLDGRGSGR